MSTGKLIPMVVAGLLTAFVVHAQDNSTPPAKDANEIFNSILQTMPKDMKARVDSASVIQKSQKTTTAQRSSAPSDPKQSVLENTNSKDASVDKLPDAVRQQVLKTMQEIEQQKTERMLEFKESKDQKNGK